MTAPIPSETPDLPNETPDLPNDLPDLPALPGAPTLLPSPVPATAVVTPARRPLTAVFRLLTAAAAATAVTAEVLLGSPLEVLSRFSIQSAILLTLVMTISARRAWTTHRPLPGALTGAALLYVVIAALVHHVLVANASSPFAAAPPAPGWHTATNVILHTAVPLAALVNWLFLTASADLHLRQAATWLAYPMTYLAFTLTRGELLLPGTPNRYLYGFLDVAEHGYKTVLSNALLLGLAFYALAVLVVTLDHIRPNPVRHRAKTGFRLEPPVG